MPCNSPFIICSIGRSREGAWIEIDKKQIEAWREICRSREGAWIEIYVCKDNNKKDGVAPVRERGLKWLPRNLNDFGLAVAPVRERGLKYWQEKNRPACCRSLP